MMHDVTVILAYETPDSPDERLATFCLYAKRVPGVGETLSFEGSLGGDMPVDLEMKVTAVQQRYCFGLEGFDDQHERVIIDAQAGIGIHPRELAALLLRFRMVRWVDLDDMQGPRYADRSKDES